MANVVFPQNLRKISRIVIGLLIIAGFGMAISGVGSARSNVKGARDEAKSQVVEEINRTIKVVEARPDYAGAWLRLSVLYEQLGDIELSKRALENAKQLKF